MLVSSRCAFALAFAPLAVAQSALQVEDFDWDITTPSRSLNYTDCYDGFRCARLQVPLDWLHPELSPEGVSLAIISLPATVPEDDPSFGGTIVTNPGGPGGSGVDFLLRYGKVLQDIASDEGEEGGKYELLSFDPRGMGESLPRADCWGDEFQRGGFLREEAVLGMPESGGGVLGRMFGRARGMGLMCVRKGLAAEEGDIRAFMSTSSVARDMVEIVDKLDEMRSQISDVEDVEDEKPNLELRSEKNPARIQYWGFSYGSVLGNYFASMFPERIGRVILEAVVDVEDYHNGTWARNLNDLPYIHDKFFAACFAAREDCSLWESSDSSSSALRERFEEWLASLDEDPGVYMDPSASSPTVHSITPYDVVQAMFRPMYSPQRLFPVLAENLAQAMQDSNFSGLFHAIERPGFENPCNADKKGETAPVTARRRYTWEAEAQRAVACGDAVDQTGLSMPEFSDYIDHLAGQSPTFGPMWSYIRAACAGWPYRPAYAFDGPWTTPPPSEDPQDPIPGKPAAGILFVNSRYDPVTPLENAYRMAGQHPGSGVLVQESYGHGTIGVPGRCRDEAVRRYFKTGEVPTGAHGKICEADCKPFQKCGPELMANTVGEGSRSRPRHHHPLQVL